MVEWMIISKITVSVLFVVGLSLITEHVSPKVAGILSGYPLGAAIALFFIGVENGKDFAAQGSVYTLGGLSASLVFVYFYYRVSAMISRQQVLISALASTGAFLVAAKILSQFDLNLVKGFAITTGFVMFFLFQFRKIPNVLVRNKVRFTPFVLIARALAAASLILLVTGLAKTVGPNWSGILSAFPITLFPLLVLIHFTYGKEQVHTIIKNFPLGLGALMVYVVSVHFLYPPLGVGVGTVLSFVAATLYLVGFSVVSSQRRRKRALVG
jgi:uncharacterized membrane protein (GlpM family)